jgi:hypothetical protein
LLVLDLGGTSTLGGAATALLLFLRARKDRSRNKCGGRGRDQEFAPHQPILLGSTRAAECSAPLKSNGRNAM